MINKNVYLTEKELERLANLTEETGLLFSELIRRAVDELLDREEEKLERQKQRKKK